jgi:hypothetical protein
VGLEPGTTSAPAALLAPPGRSGSTRLLLPLLLLPLLLLPLLLLPLLLPYTPSSGPGPCLSLLKVYFVMEPSAWR